MIKTVNNGRQRLPKWLKKGFIDAKETKLIRNILEKYNLNTVCDGAKCPNKGECFAKNTATFLIMGNICTRNCHFCSIQTKKALPLDKEEPLNLAKAIEELNLSYVVITSVTRDDLEDGGANHFKETIFAIRQTNPHTKIEVLVPDFKGDHSALQTILSCPIEVFNHNIETVPSLYKRARPQASYERSLNILKTAKSLKPEIITKTGLMIGLGETKEELISTFQDIQQAKIDILTIGQYIQPLKACLMVEKYYTEQEFQEIEALASQAGIPHVVASPLVRSSYKAFECFTQASNIP
jgi:lipoic acid synthetase